MVSKRAEADVMDMWDAGLRPTFGDIVRLNALALRVDGARGAFALGVLPRVAFIGGVSFREPTVGSEIWLAAASRLFDVDDAETFMMLRAFSLSCDQSALPDAADEKGVMSAVMAFRGRLAAFTVRQIVAAVGYAVHGFSAHEGETAKPREGTGADDGGELRSVHAGLLRQGVVYRLGSMAELRGLQPSVLRGMLIHAMSAAHGSDVGKDAADDADNDYLRTLDDIVARLRCAADSKDAGRRNQYHQGGVGGGFCGKGDKDDKQKEQQR